MLDWAIYILTLFVIYRWLNSKPPNFPPGPPTVPIVGSLPFIEGKNFHLHLEKMREKYGPVIGMKFGPKPAVAICGSAQVLEALKRDDFAARPSNIAQIRSSPGVMFANGEIWKVQRRFSLRHLRDFGFGKTSVNEMMVTEFEDFCRNVIREGQEIQVNGLFNTSAINLIWAMVAGVRFSYGDSNFKELADHLQKFFRSSSPTGDIFIAVPKLKNFVALFYEREFDKIDNALATYFKRTIAEHQRTRTDEPRDFIDVYLSQLEAEKKEPNFSNLNLIEVCRDLFSAGTESSSNSMSFCLLYLILHPEWQDKLYEEINQELGSRAPSLEDKNSLPQVEAFMTETMRCNPIAPINIPRATTKDTTFEGYFIPKDSFLSISLWSVLQDKKHWGDPENFRPQRFLDTDGKFIRDPHLIFFGAGSRVCLGESMARSFVFLFLVSVIRKYKIRLPKGAPKPPTVCMSGITVAPQPFEVIFESR